jgi:histidinol-phosphate aminotransferase
MADTMINTSVRPAGCLAGLSPYRPPAFDDRIEIRLDANEGPPATSAVLEGLATVPVETMRRYPDAGELERSIAARWGIEPSRVVVTNGGDDAIDRLCRAVLEPGRKLITHTPTFEMIDRGARLAGARVSAQRWVEGPFPLHEMLGRIDQSTGLVAVVSPNNPTGGVIPVPTIRTLAEAAQTVTAAMLVDLAYVEFASEDPTADLLALGNVVVVRTLSKAYGLAGLRVGYAIAPPTIAEWLRTTGGPYPVSGVSLRLALAAFESDPAVRATYINRVRAERAELTRQLTASGAQVLASNGNFVSAYVRDSADLRERLAALGVAIRAFEGGGDLTNLVRITTPGNAEHFARLLGALAELGEL